MRKRFYAAAAAGLICAALMGCIGDKVAGGTGVGNPTGVTEFALVASSDSTRLAKVAAGTVRNPDSSFSVTDAGGTVFTIRQAFANVDEIRIRLPDGTQCGDATGIACESGDVRLPGPFVADLMKATLHPDAGAFKIPAGAYKRIELRFDPLAAPDSTAPALQGHSLFISGDFAYAGRTDRRFSIALDFGEQERFESGAGVSVLDTGFNKLLVVMKVDQWLKKANLTQCLGDGSLSLDSAGNLAVDHNHTCGNLEQIVKDGITGSCGLGEEHQDGGH